MKDIKPIPRAKESIRRDDDIMATNNSSIVSKRSVERLYFSHEPEFFRYFVKKPQRRSPLINRGYWLRMKAIDHTVQQFLEEPSEKRKFVINLGCGYDPLPWQCLTRYAESCQNVTFIDIDYPPLLEKKRTAVLTTPQLHQMFTNLSPSKKEGVILESDQYVQVGADLRDIPTLSKILGSLFNFQDSHVLFTAEVSITYMRLPYADTLIQWAGTFPDARFCLLEQILPDGIKHPFAKTMLAHFRKLQTPLQSVELYPTSSSQETRFRKRGWLKVKARNLWELWNAQDFLMPEQRMALDQIEPFDEWEEFALFGEHYFLLVASNNANSGESPQNTNMPISSDVGISSDVELLSHSTAASIPIQLQHFENANGQGCRRFGATLLLNENGLGLDAVANYAGMGMETRLNTFDVYSEKPLIAEASKPVSTSSKGPSPRMCHSIIDLGNTALICGGRTSPDNALSDCWIYDKKKKTFERVQDLPVGRYRHSTIKINSECILLFGGKSDSKTVEQNCLIWNKWTGWQNISPAIAPGVTDDSKSNGPPALYGATMFSTHSESEGFLLGGITKDGTLSPYLWAWQIKWKSSSESKVLPIITFQKVQETSISRFSASITTTHHDKLYLIGGVGATLLTSDTEVVLMMADLSQPTKLTYETCPLILDDSAPRPLLIGTSVAAVPGETLIMGGGAVCFSFGTYWNKMSYHLKDAKSISCGSSDYLTSEPSPISYINHKPWRLIESTMNASGISDKKTISNSVSDATLGSKRLQDVCAESDIPRTRITDAQDLERVMREAKPVILEGLDLGICTSLWSSKYLKESIGNKRPVVVHEATTKSMDFQTKNFRYTTMPFGDFIDAAEKGEKLYLRALSEEKPSELPTDLCRDFPSISNDFRLPPELRFVSDNAHSSPLRISGDIAMWLHYDVMANVLCQIRGTKRLLLFPPTDINHLNFPPGASSSSINVFSTPYPPSTHPHSATLDPGDVLFLPPLWLHAATPTSNFSVAVNIFFRNLEKGGYAAGRDVYGNRDLAAYERGRADLKRIVRAFEGVEGGVREAYLGRLVEELRGLI